jgi:1-acyl-sn-glycerol-3-phosphate acyltransferase
MQYLRSLLFMVALFVLTILYAIVLLLLCWLPRRQRYSVARAWARSVLAALRLTCGLSYRVVGSQNIPSGAHISMWKHSSAWETIAQILIFPPQAWVLKRELMWIPLMGWAMHFLKPIAINRQATASAVNQVLEQGAARLREGFWILIFPEGTRMPAGQTRRYGVSGALLASKVGCKIIPVAHNAGYFWPRRGLLKRPGVVTVVVGPAIDAYGRDPRELNDIAQQWIETKVKEIAPTIH